MATRPGLPKQPSETCISGRSPPPTPGSEASAESCLLWHGAARSHNLPAPCGADLRRPGRGRAHGQDVPLLRPVVDRGGLQAPVLRGAVRKQALQGARRARSKVMREVRAWLAAMAEAWLGPPPTALQLPDARAISEVSSIGQSKLKSTQPEASSAAAATGGACTRGRTSYDDMSPENTY